MLNGEVWIYNPRTTDCHLVYNNRPNLPSNIHDSSFREISLPNKESFEAIAAIPAQQFYVMVGEGLYLKNQLNNSECSNIDDDGVYQNVLGKSIFAQGKKRNAYNLFISLFIHSNL